MTTDGVKGTRTQRLWWNGAAVLCVLLWAANWYVTLQRPSPQIHVSPALEVAALGVGGPGQQAGVQVGDRLVAVADVPVHTVMELLAIYDRHRTGDVVTFTVQRGGQTVRLPVTLGRYVVGDYPLAGTLIALLFGALGWWVYRRQPGSATARLFFAGCLSVFLRFGLVVGDWPPGVVGRLVGLAAFPGVVLHFFSVFPVRRTRWLPLQRWFHVPSLFFFPGALAAYGAGLAQGVGPYFGEPLFAVERAMSLYAIACAAAGVVLVVEAYHRLDDPLIQRQSQWVALSTALSVTILLLYELGSSLGQATAGHAALAVLATGAAPVGFACAILRYRLLEIDVVVHRGAVYVLLTLAFLATLLVVLSTVISLMALAGMHPMALAGAVVLVTLLLVLLYEPVRRTIEWLANRLLFRRQALWQEATAALRQQLRSLARLDDLTAALTRDLPERLGIAGGWLLLFDPLEPQTARCLTTSRGPLALSAAPVLAAWVAKRDGKARGAPLLLREVPSDWPVEAVAPWAAAGAELCLPLWHHGELVGLWLLGALAGKAQYQSAELALLQGAAGSAAAAVHNAPLYEELVDLTQRLEARVADRTRDLTGILARFSHALATPVTAIHGHSEFALSHSSRLSELDVENLSAIRQNAEQLLALGRGVRSLAQLATGRLPLRLEPVDLGALVRQTAREMLPTLQAASLRLQLDLPADALWAFGDGAHLAAVLRAVLDNACAYTPAGGLVQIGLHLGPAAEATVPPEEAGAAWLLTVSDNGIGIPPEEMDELFTPFFRGEADLVRSRPGNGLGLAVAKGLMEAQGGSIRAEGAPAVGTIVNVAIPRWEGGPAVAADVALR
ncbi:MAG: PDZ domain-containing protein [Chloroflexi bacterium]|nr:PDZ domain-containing protein [Chloroflexota bacterium]